MELKDYVAEALGQILSGISEAQRKEHGTHINAANFGIPQGLKVFNSNIGTFTIVDFDIAVSAETSGGGGANLKVFGIGAEAAAEHKAGRANRLTFSVPVRLPDGDKSKYDAWHNRQNRSSSDDEGGF